MPEVIPNFAARYAKTYPKSAPPEVIPNFAARYAKTYPKSAPIETGITEEDVAADEKTLADLKVRYDRTFPSQKPDPLEALRRIFGWQPQLETQPSGQPQLKRDIRKPIEEHLASQLAGKIIRRAGMGELIESPEMKVFLGTPAATKEGEGISVPPDIFEEPPWPSRKLKILADIKAIDERLGIGRERPLMPFESLYKRLTNPTIEEQEAVLGIGRKTPKLIMEEEFKQLTPLILVPCMTVGGLAAGLAFILNRVKSGYSGGLKAMYEEAGKTEQEGQDWSKVYKNIYDGLLGKEFYHDELLNEVYQPKSGWAKALVGVAGVGAEIFADPLMMVTFGLGSMLGRGENQIARAIAKGMPIRKEALGALPMEIRQNAAKILIEPDPFVRVEKATGFIEKIMGDLMASKEQTETAKNAFLKLVGGISGKYFGETGLSIVGRQVMRRGVIAEKIPEAWKAKWNQIFKEGQNPVAGFFNMIGELPQEAKQLVYSHLDQYGGRIGYAKEIEDAINKALLEPAKTLKRAGFLKPVLKGYGVRQYSGEKMAQLGSAYETEEAQKVYRSLSPEQRAALPMGSPEELISMSQEAKTEASSAYKKAQSIALKQPKVVEYWDKQLEKAHLPIDELLKKAEEIPGATVAAYKRVKEQFPKLIENLGKGDYPISQKVSILKQFEDLSAHVKKMGVKKAEGLSKLQKQVDFWQEKARAAEEAGDKFAKASAVQQVKRLKNQIVEATGKDPIYLLKGIPENERRIMNYIQNKMEGLREGDLQRGLDLGEVDNYLHHRETLESRRAREIGKAPSVGPTKSYLKHRKGLYTIYGIGPIEFENISRSVRMRMEASYSNWLSIDLKNALVKYFGKPLKGAEEELLKEGKRLLAPGTYTYTVTTGELAGKKFAMPTAFNGILEKLSNSRSTAEFINGLDASGVYSHIMNWWKGAQTIGSYRPGFVIRNAIGSGIFNVLSGVVNPLDYAVAIRATLSKDLSFMPDSWFRRLLDRAVGAHSKDIDIGEFGEALYGRAKITPEELKRLCKQYNIGGTGWGAELSRIATSAKGLEKTWWQNYLQPINPFSNKNLVARAISTSNAAVEDVMRTTMFINYLKKGNPPWKASMAVRFTHFKYNELSLFERWMRNYVFPFYTWYGGAMKKLIDIAHTNPGALGAFYRTVDTIENLDPLSEGEKQWIESWHAKSASKVLPFIRVDPKTGEYLASSPGYRARVSLTNFIPPYTINMLADIPSILANSNPIIQTPLEAAFGKELWKNRDIPDSTAAPAWIAYIAKFLKSHGMEHQMALVGVYETDKGWWAIPGTLNFWINKIPQFAQLGRMWKQEGLWKESYDAAISSLFLAKISPVIPELVKERKEKELGLEEGELKKAYKQVESAKESDLPWQMKYEIQRKIRQQTRRKP